MADYLGCSDRPVRSGANHPKGHPMPDFRFVLLYVENPPASAAFYADLLGRPPIETSATFAMLPLSDKVTRSRATSNVTVPMPASVCADSSRRVASPSERASVISARNAATFSATALCWAGVIAARNIVGDRHEDLVEAIITVVLIIGCFDLLVLYSAAGGSIHPWALSQGVRFFVFLAGAIILSRVKENVWNLGALPAYAVLIVLLLIIDPALRSALEEGCRRHEIPCIAALDPVVAAMSRYLGAPISSRVGAQHTLDTDYFNRMEALNYAMGHDDGQGGQDLEQADVVLVGVSRTSKTPTCIYLAHRGVRAANHPLVPGAPIPPALLALKKTLIVGLIASPDRLIQIRRNRLRRIWISLS
eukprot:gene414-594_t